MPQVIETLRQDREGKVALEHHEPLLEGFVSRQRQPGNGGRDLFSELCSQARCGKPKRRVLRLVRRGDR